MGSDQSDNGAEIAALKRRLAELEATQRAGISDSAGAAQRGGDALGERAVGVGGDNSGTIVTGTQIVINYVASTATRSKEAVAQRVAGYLRWLRERTESIELRGIERAGGAPVVVLPLETAYVPLRAKPILRVGGEQGQIEAQRPLKHRSDARSHDIERPEHETDVALSQVLGLGNRLVITGGPGSGKTTVLLHMAWALASSLLTGQPDPAQSRLGVTILPSALPLPVLVPLASFARHRRNLPNSVPAPKKTLAYFISHHLISKQADFDLPANFFVQLLKEGRDVLLLLDGLDEVANEHERAEVRQSVEDLVGGRESMRVIVTCRTVAYRSGRTGLAANFREIAVQPLDFEQQITPMVRQAYACISPADVALRSERMRDLLRGIETLEQERRARLGAEAGALVDSPLMVRLLLIVHMNNRTLPDERADLFDKAINALLQVDYGREESNIGELSTDWKLFREMAQLLAFHMHQQGRDQGREIDEPSLKEALSTEAEFKPRIEDFLTHARQRGSVLEERDGAYRFIHLAFQEFLVARFLHEVRGGDGREAILAFLDDRLEDPWWREPVLLLVGYTAVNSAKSARDFVEALAKAGKSPNARVAAAELAGASALEWRERGATLRAYCAQCIVDLLGWHPVASTKTRNWPTVTG
jgi:predicted NACHT family NTPase